MKYINVNSTLILLIIMCMTSCSALFKKIEKINDEVNMNMVQ